MTTKFLVLALLWIVYSAASLSFDRMRDPPRPITRQFFGVIMGILMGAVAQY